MVISEPRTSLTVVVVLRSALLNSRSAFASAVESVRTMPSTPLTPLPKPPDEVTHLVQQQTRLTLPAVARLIADYQAGQTIYQLAKSYGVNRHTVTRHLRRAGIRLRMDGLSPEQIEQAVDLYAQGWSLAKIAAKFGVTADTVRARLLEQGVRMRDTHGRQR